MTPYYERDGLTLHLADCREAMAEMPENSVDAIVTDPPYGLEFMGKEWDKLLVRERDAAYPSCRHAHGPNAYLAGMKAQEWHYTWAVAALRVLKPGGHALVFGGTRTFHRLTCALEDAGFEIRDCLSWLYGSGFPKSLDVSKAIDKAAGVLATQAHRFNTAGGKENFTPRDKSFRSDYGYEHTPATDAARQWDGWGTALKPAWEPIVLCRKPLTGTVAANVQEWGTGAINVDGCRIGTMPEDARAMERCNTPGSGRFIPQQQQRQASDASFLAGAKGGGKLDTSAGRWPANLLLECTCEETREGRIRSQSSPQTTHGSRKRRSKFGMTEGSTHYADPDGKETVRIHTDPNCPCAMLDAQSGELHTHPGKMRGNATAIFGNAMRKSGEVVSVGSSGGASRFFYCAKADSAERGGSRHPTVKPLDLMRYLCRLITPPKGLILDPFAGSGTTLEAAHLEGFRCIGIEMSEEYCADAERRLGKYLL